MVAAVPALLSNSSSASDSNSLPPALAALRSMKGEAKPITVEERAERQEKARRLMRENNLSAILLTQGTSLGLFHRHSLVGRRALVCHGAARQRRSILCGARV